MIDTYIHTYHQTNLLFIFKVKVIFYQMTILLMSGNLCSLVWYLNKINHSERVTETYQEVTLPPNVCLDSLADA